MSELNIFLQDTVVPWLQNHGIAIGAIIIIAYLLRKFGSIFIGRLVKKAVRGDRYLSQEAEEKRENTLIGVFTAALKVLVWLMALMMILAESGVNITPLIAGAGIAGLAFGFGGQYLIKDLISGFFIIMENQYRVGDVICVNEKCGLVERINMRLTVLRDLDGTVHHVPNGEIATASNLTKQFSRVLLDVGVSYDSDLEHVISVVNKVGEDMASDEEWKEFITKPPAFLRVEDFGESAIIIRILGDTLPLKQWDVAGEYRKRLKIAFDKEGIVIPYPQRVLHGRLEHAANK